MKKIFLILLLAFTACAPKSSSKLDVTLELSPSTPRIGKTNIVLKLERNKQLLEGWNVNVEGNMTHAGMGTVDGAVIELGAGKYQVNNFDFNMSGDWVLTVTAKKDNETLTNDVKLEVVQ
jgi:YtkA-like